MDRTRTHLYSRATLGLSFAFRSARTSARTAFFLQAAVGALLFVLANAQLANAQTPGATANDPFFNSSNQVGDCGNAYGFGSCTANDFRITSIRLSNIVDSCVSDTDYFQADLTVDFSKAQPIRYDVMAYFYRGEDAGQPFSLSPDSADTGAWCTRVGLSNNTPVFASNGNPTALLTGDIDDEDNDGNSPIDSDSFCYDAPSGAANGRITQTEFAMVLPCKDSDSNGIVDISTCTGWANNAQGFCDGPEYDGANEPQNGTGSKCNCATFDTDPAITLPDISVTKSCAGDGNNGTDAPDGSGNYAVGDVVQCEIIISNSGGTLDGATAANQEGFFFRDDYDQTSGSISGVSVVNSSNTTNESFVDNLDTLSVYPDDILTNGTVTITYFYTVAGRIFADASGVEIPNEVCPVYFDSGNMSETVNGDNCADDSITTTPVTLSDFSATQYGNIVDLSWSTATETNNLGFNLYGVYGSSRIKLNAQIIPSQAVNSLDVLDYNLTLPRKDLVGVQQFYLEDIDLTGASNFAGPFELSNSKKPKRVKSTRTDWKAIGLNNNGKAYGKEKASNKGKKANSNESSAANGKVVLEVSESGLVVVSSEALAAFGITHQDLSKGRYLLTDFRGEAVASNYIAGKRKTGSLEFVADVNKTFYGVSSRYTLSITDQRNSAKRMKLASDFPVATGSNQNFYVERSEVATDVLYHIGSPVESDPWVIDRVIAFGDQAAILSVDVPLDSPASVGVPAQVSAQVLGGFDPDGSQDRLVGLLVDGEELDAKVGYGLRAVDLGGETLIDEGSEDLSVSISLLQNNQFGIDISYLNNVVVDYPREFVARDGQLRFESANSSFTVAGFSNSDVKVLAVVGEDTVSIGTFSPKQGQITFDGVEGAQEYFAVSTALAQVPTIETISEFSIGNLTGDSLVIANPVFIGAELNDYLSWRDAELGTSSALVSTQDIYCQYSGCVRSAIAIKDFVSEFAAQNSLKSVMLVGGDVYDYHDNLGVGATAFIPTLYAKTSELIRFAPVDALFGDVDNDGVPDVPVGRLPVRTQLELANLLEKSKLFKQQEGVATVVLTADEQTSQSAYNFAEGSDRVAQILGNQGWTLNRQYLDDYLSQDATGSNRSFYVEQARQGIMQSLNAGPRLSIYTGHSSAVSWSFANLFNYDTTTQLSNQGKPGLYLQWGCYNTYYSHPTIESLSHGLLLSGDQGAAVVIGASSLTNAVTEEQFAQLIQADLVTQNVSVGEAMVSAKQALADENGVVDVDILWSVTLLGDPALRL